MTSGAPDSPRLPQGVEEALELLLPECDADRRDEAERVADFLRLLQADAGRAGEGVSVDLAQARDDLARSGRERLEGALHDLCAHYLAALIDPDRFLDPGLADRPAAAAWRELESLRAEFDGLAELPAPQEPTSAVAARLIESLARHAGDRPAAVWHARLTAVLRGARAGEAAFRSLADGFDDDPVPSAVWAGVIECALDRGAVHTARDLAEECAVLPGAEERLSRLLVWCRLLAGDFEAARELDRSRGPWKGALPRRLLRLRRELPGELALLTGRAAVGTGTTPPVDLELDRAADGAQLVAVVQLHPTSGAELIAHEASAALRPRVERWFEDCEHAASRSGTPEHRLLRDARAQAWHRTDSDALPDSLGGADCRAALLQPILDEEGEACGWLRFECSHHLLPSTARAEALARAWRTELLRRRGRWEVRDRTEAWSAPASQDSDLARAFEQLVAGLAIKTARRAWWGFELDGDQPRLVARGGEGLGPLSEAPGRGRALKRALACGGPVRGTEPDPGLYLHGQSAAGVVLCLRLSGRTVGALAIESERRRDFSADEVDRLARRADEGVLGVRLAQFATHHQSRFGQAVFADVASPGFRAFHGELQRAQSGPAPLALTGPAGSGKRVMARWAWFECAGEAPARAEADVSDWLAGGARGDAYLTGLEALDQRAQLELVRALETHARSSRLAFGLRIDPRHASTDGRMIPELAILLGRECHAVPGLAERREELRNLIEARLRDLSRAQGRSPARLDDDALAFLWRQSWDGNWRELNAQLHHLASRDRQGPVTADELAVLWRACGRDPVLRLPSRKPAVELLHSALLTTATAGGRANKRRAALYLGWDPDTLSARLAEAELDGPDLAASGAAWLG